eukprot:scaffold35454_cov51-Attheya_sp.AAC.1
MHSGGLMADGYRYDGEENCGSSYQQVLVSRPVFSSTNKRRFASRLRAIMTSLPRLKISSHSLYRIYYAIGQRIITSIPLLAQDFRKRNVHYWS